MSWATCHTAGCNNAEKPIDVGTLSTTDDDTGETTTITDVSCGVCFQPITDITDTEPDPPDDTEVVDPPWNPGDV